MPGRLLEVPFQRTNCCIRRRRYPDGIVTYLIDRNEDLYGQNLRVAFVERLRGEERFDSVEALVEQMRRDIEDARRICAEFGAGQ